VIQDSNIHINILDKTLEHLAEEKQQQQQLNRLDGLEEGGKFGEK